MGFLVLPFEEYSFAQKCSFNMNEIYKFKVIWNTLSDQKSQFSTVGDLCGRDRSINGQTLQLLDSIG